METFNVSFLSTIAPCTINISCAAGVSYPYSEITTIPANVLVAFSMVILLFLVLTISFIRKLRDGRPQRRLAKFMFINHCASYLLALAVFLIGFYMDSLVNTTICKVLSVLSHFFILLTLMWCLGEMVTLYYLYIVIHGPQFDQFRWKFLVFNLAIPILLVIVSLSTDLQSYSNIHQICWIRPDHMYYLLALPAGLIITASLFSVIITLIIVIRNPSQTVQASKTKRKILLRIFLGFSSVVLNGSSWFIGYLMSTVNHVLHYYIFSVLSVVYALVRDVQALIGLFVQTALETHHFSY